MQISSYYLSNYMECPKMTQKIVCTAHLYLQNVPQLCLAMKQRFPQLVARTLIIYNIKWQNSSLKALTRKRKGKKRKVARHPPEAAKLAKLMRQWEHWIVICQQKITLLHLPCRYHSFDACAFTYSLQILLIEKSVACTTGIQNSELRLNNHNK